MTRLQKLLLAFVWIAPLMVFPTDNHFTGTYATFEKGHVPGFGTSGGRGFYSPLWYTLTWNAATPADLFVRTKSSEVTLSYLWKFWFMWIAGAIALTIYLRRDQADKIPVKNPNFERDEMEEWYRNLPVYSNAAPKRSANPEMDNERSAKDREIEMVGRIRRKMAEEGDARSQYFLGLAYAHGVDVIKDEAEAVKWYRKAADQDHAEAQRTLGFAYAKGFGVTQDEEEAVKWYRKAADQGHIGSQYLLGYMYFNGKGVKKDFAEYVRWSRKAAEQGDGGAQFMLGVAYADGLGVTRDFVPAYMWHNLSVASGIGLAKALSDLEAKMTPDQIAEAQKLSREFKPVIQGESGAKP